MGSSADVARLSDALERRGLLLLQDPVFPSAAAIVAGERIRGSWWGHPAGHRIFAAVSELDDHPDVATAKLVSGKVTFVHRTLWPALIAVGRARDAWQLRGLNAAARGLLARVDAETTVRASGKAAAALERALLVASRQVHTDSGKHALALSTWTAFAKHRGVALRRRAPARARAALEAIVDGINGETGARGTLPWSSG